MHQIVSLTLAALALWMPPGAGNRLVTVPIGYIPALRDAAPTTWGLGGMSIVHVRATADGVAPISRTLAWDARNVEILSRVDRPGLRPEAIRIARYRGHVYITVANFRLLEVRQEDADAAGTSVPELARAWLTQIRHVLPQVAPIRS